MTVCNHIISYQPSLLRPSWVCTKAWCMHADVAAWCKQQPVSKASQLQVDVDVMHSVCGQRKRETRCGHQLLQHAVNSMVQHYLLTCDPVQYACTGTAGFQLPDNLVVEAG